LASTNLEVVISARDQFTGTANRVIGTLHRMDGAAGRVGKGVGQLGLGLGKAGLIAAGAFATGIGAAAKAGMDFEDAFAGVRKTVEGTKPQLDGLGLELRALATRIPVKATDLAALAQEAGALGVPRAEVAKFTEVVSKLSAATTGLSTDVAAEAFGKLGNVLRVHGDDYARMASSLVALGNAGASSEADIIETAKRFGAAGAQAKLSAAQVLGFASAIASLGVEPEAAGSSLSRLFNNITKYIGTGNAKIKAFAQTAGMSVKAFSKFFADDASGAVELFLKKLSGSIGSRRRRS
jgi:TP901 family phage tail tape measure protein